MWSGSTGASRLTKPSGGSSRGRHSKATLTRRSCSRPGRSSRSGPRTSSPAGAPPRGTCSTWGMASCRKPTRPCWPGWLTWSTPSRSARPPDPARFTELGVFPDASSDREADERVDLAGYLEPVAELFGRRVAAKHDQVSGAAACLGLPGYLPCRLDGLQAFDLPQRGLDTVRLVVGDDPYDQTRTDVPVVRAGVMASLVELGIGTGHQQFAEQWYARLPEPVADVREAAELLLTPGSVKIRVIADEHLGVVGPDGVDVLEPLIAPLQREPLVPAGLDRYRQHHRLAAALNRVDDALAVAFVDEHADAAGGHRRKGLLQALVDQLLGGSHGRGLTLVGIVALDVEQPLAERFAMVHRQDEQRIVVPRLPARSACHGRHGTRPAWGPNRRGERPPVRYCGGRLMPVARFPAVTSFPVRQAGRGACGVLSSVGRGRPGRRPGLRWRRTVPARPGKLASRTR